MVVDAAPQLGVVNLKDLVVVGRFVELLLLPSKILLGVEEETSARFFGRMFSSSSSISIDDSAPEPCSNNCFISL